jgi:hypothetical protein
MALRATLDCDIARLELAPVGRMARSGPGPSIAAPKSNGRVSSNARDYASFGLKRETQEVLAQMDPRPIGSTNGVGGWKLVTAP